MKVGDLVRIHESKKPYRRCTGIVVLVKGEYARVRWNLPGRPTIRWTQVSHLEVINENR